MVFRISGGGWSGPSFLADIICEQPPMKEIIESEEMAFFTLHNMTLLDTKVQLGAVHKLCQRLKEEGEGLKKADIGGHRGRGGYANADIG